MGADGVDKQDDAQIILPARGGACPRAGDSGTGGSAAMGGGRRRSFGMAVSAWPGLAGSGYGSMRLGLGGGPQALALAEASALDPVWPRLAPAVTTSILASAAASLGSAVISA